jgi:hypothetical protein
MTFKQLRDHRSQFDMFRTECDGWSAAKELADKELATRVRKWNLASSDRDLDEIARLQTKSALLPAKIADMEVVREEREQALREAGHEFIRDSLAPLIVQQERKTRAYLEEKLAEVVPDGAGRLEAPIHASRPMITLTGYSYTATRDDGYRYATASAYVDALLRCYSEVERFDFKMK